MNFLTALGAMLSVWLGYSLIKLLVKLGVGFVIYTGLKALVDNLFSRFYEVIGGVPSDILGYLNLAGMSDVIAIISAAVSVRLIFALGMRDDGSVKKFRLFGD